MIRSPDCHFWELLGLDNSDLAVIVAGDICEGLIDFKDYLQYYKDLEYLTMFRFCLLLRYSVYELLGKSLDELFLLSEEGLERRFCFYKSGDDYMREYVLQLLQYPFAKWGPGCLRVEYSSLDFDEEIANGPLDVEKLKEELKSMFRFKYFVPYTESNLGEIFWIKHP